MLFTEVNITDVCVDCLKNICLQFKNDTCESEAQTTRTAIVAGLCGLVLVTLIIAITCCILIQRCRDVEREYSVIMANREHPDKLNSMQRSVVAAPNSAQNQSLHEVPVSQHQFKDLTKSPTPLPSTAISNAFEVNTMATEIADSKSKETNATDMAFTAPKDSVMVGSEMPRSPPTEMNRREAGKKPHKKLGRFKPTKPDSTQKSRFKFVMNSNR